MSRFVLIFVAATLLLPSLALAKRAAPAKVEPVIHQGIRYVAPNDDGRRAYIEAWDVRTNKKLWDLTIFTNRIDPKLEEDVQHVFIKTLNVRDGTVIVTSERGETYRVDLKTKAVTQSEHVRGQNICFLLRFVFRTGFYRNNIRDHSPIRPSHFTPL
jgi:hypothetical protein